MRPDHLRGLPALTASPHSLGELRVEALASIDDVAAADWDACANPATRGYNPFVSHTFLAALERSGSAVARTGWLARHLVVRAASGAVVAAMPCYLKSHSRGEYVFDYGWAEAIERAGGRYYPKLQASVPFTPATGPRLLVAEGTAQEALRSVLARAAVALCRELQASSVHVTFLTEPEYRLLGEAGFLQRLDTQFHWHNEDFASFDGFLAALASRKRKNIRKEREAVARLGLDIVALTGSDITEAHWDAFFAFYMDTGGRKWGSPYLTRSFFSLIGETMADRVLLILAGRAGRWIAGAINFIGSDALYGRNWGAVEHHEFLHFELCYYRAIEWAIAHRLARVEAGAQGPHKLARGYLPVTTRSCHHIADPRLRRAVADYLEMERQAVAEDGALLARHSPFRRDGEEADF